MPSRPRADRKVYPADTDRSMLGYGDTVRVQLARHVDAHGGQSGVVRRTRLRGADIWATVEFADGERCEYIDNELKRV